MKDIIFCLLVCLTLTYDTGKAISYARKNFKKYYPNYKNYHNSGGVYANFISQCLIAGGQSLSGYTGLDPKGTLLLVSY